MFRKPAGTKTKKIKNLTSRVQRALAGLLGTKLREKSVLMPEIAKTRDRCLALRGLLSINFTSRHCRGRPFTKHTSIY